MVRHASSIDAQGTIALGLFALGAGSAFLFTADATATIPPLSLTALRLIFGSLALFIIHRLLLGQLSLASVAPTNQTRLMILALGCLNTIVPYTLYAYAFNFHMLVAVEAMLSGASPLVAAVITRFRGAKWSLPLTVGLFFGFGGVVLIALRSSLTPAADVPLWQPIVGNILVLVAVISKASASVLAGARLSHIPFLSLATLQAAVGAVIATLLACFIDAPGITASHNAKGFYFFTQFTGATFGSLAYLAFVASCLVYVLQFFLIDRLGALPQTTVDFIVPIVGVVDGVLFRHEGRDLSIASIIFVCCGAGCMVLGVALVHHHARFEKQVDGGARQPLLSPSVSFS